MKRPRDRSACSVVQGLSCVEDGGMTTHPRRAWGCPTAGFRLASSISVHRILCSSLVSIEAMASDLRSRFQVQGFGGAQGAYLAQTSGGLTLRASEADAFSVTQSVLHCGIDVEASTRSGGGSAEPRKCELSHM